MAIPLLFLKCSLLLGLFVSCIAAPIHKGEAGLPEVDLPQAVTGPAVLYISVGFVLICGLVIFGCTCCMHKDMQGIANPSHNPALQFGENNVSALQSSSEFTIFPPCSSVINLQPVSMFGNEVEKVVFEPLPDILPKRHINGQSLAQSSKPAHFSALLKMKSSLNDWFDDPASNFPRSNLQYLQEIGTGWFGPVVEGEAQMIIDGQEKTPVVVKILREEASPSEHLYFLHDVQAYRDLQHPNVVRLLGRCLESDPFLLIMEHTRTNLKSYLTCNRDRLINEDGHTDRLLQIACDIASGLLHMHEHNFTHNDLAAHNCFVGMNNVVKIGDYGLSLDMFKEHYFCVGDMALPIRWLAPESLACSASSIETKELTKEANIWSLGVVLWEIVELGELPYSELTDQEVLQKVIMERKMRLPLPHGFHPLKTEIYQIMELCWQAESCRPKGEAVLGLLTQLKTNRKLPDSYSSFEQRWDALSSKTHSSSCSLPQKFENDFVSRDAGQNSAFAQEGSNGSFNLDSSSYELFNGIMDACRSPSLRALNGSFDELQSEDGERSILQLDHHAAVREDAVGAAEGTEVITPEQITEAIRDLDAVLASESLVLDVDSQCVASESLVNAENRVKAQKDLFCERANVDNEERLPDNLSSYTNIHKMPYYNDEYCHKETFYKNGISLSFLPDDVPPMVETSTPSSSCSLPSNSDFNAEFKVSISNSLLENCKTTPALPDILITEPSLIKSSIRKHSNVNDVSGVEGFTKDPCGINSQSLISTSSETFEYNEEEHCTKPFTNTAIENSLSLNMLETKSHPVMKSSTLPSHNENRDLQFCYSANTRGISNTSFASCSTLVEDNAVINGSHSALRRIDNQVAGSEEKFPVDQDQATRNLSSEKVTSHALNGNCDLSNAHQSLNEEHREFFNSNKNCFSKNDFTAQVNGSCSLNEHARAISYSKTEHEEANFLPNGTEIAIDDDNCILNHTDPDVCDIVDSSGHAAFVEIKNFYDVKISDVCDSPDSLNSMPQEMNADYCASAVLSSSNGVFSLEDSHLTKAAACGENRMFTLGLRDIDDDEDDESENWIPEYQHEHHHNNKTMSNGIMTLEPLPEDELLCTSNDQEIVSAGLELDLKMTSSEDYDDDDDHLEQEEVLKIDIETNEAILVDTSETLIGFVPSRSIELLQECDCVISNFEADATANKEKSFEAESGWSEEEAEDVNANRCSAVSNEDLTTDPISSYGENFISSDDGLESEYDKTDNEVSSFPKEDEQVIPKQSDKHASTDDDVSIIKDSNDNPSVVTKTELNNNNNNPESTDLYNDILYSVQPTKSVIWHSDETLDVLEDDNKRINSIIIEGKEVLAGLPYQDNLTPDSPTSDTRDHAQFGSWPDFHHLGISGYPSPSCSASSTPSHDILYTPDFESESEETSSSCSSTSGSFECIHNKFKNVGDISAESTKKESSPVTEAAKDQSPLKIFSKTWDCHATPNRGLLKSPEKKLMPIRKSVSFHEDPQLVFQYPPASDSSEDESAQEDNFMRRIDYTSYADWELHASEDDEIPEEMIEIEELESEPYNRSLRFRGTPYSGTSLYTITGFSEEEDSDLCDSAPVSMIVQSPPDEKLQHGLELASREFDTKSRDPSAVWTETTVRAHPSGLVHIEEVIQEEEMDSDEGFSAVKDPHPVESLDMEAEENYCDYKEEGIENSDPPQPDSAEPFVNGDAVEFADASSSSLDLMDVSDSSDCNQNRGEIVEARNSEFEYFGLDHGLLNRMFNGVGDFDEDFVFSESNPSKDSCEAEIERKSGGNENADNCSDVRQSEESTIGSSSKPSERESVLPLEESKHVENKGSKNPVSETKDSEPTKTLASSDLPLATHNDKEQPEYEVNNSQKDVEELESCKEEFLKYVNLPPNDRGGKIQDGGHASSRDSVKHENVNPILANVPSIIVTDADEPDWNEEGMSEFLEEHLKFYKTEDSDQNNTFSVTPNYSENPFEQEFSFIQSRTFDDDCTLKNHQACVNHVTETVQSSEDTEIQNTESSHQSCSDH